MSGPLLTAEQRTFLFEEATSLVTDTTFMFHLSDPDHPERRENFPEDVRRLRDAVSVLDCLGWHPDEQSNPLTELRGNLEDHEALERFAKSVVDRYQPELDRLDDEAKSFRASVSGGRALMEALSA